MKIEILLSHLEPDLPLVFFLQNGNEDCLRFYISISTFLINVSHQLF